MPKQIYKLNDFSGGLNWNRDPRDIADNELVQADFCYLDRAGGVRGSGVMNTGNGTIPPEGVHTAGGGFYSFESDHVDGSTAVQVGAQWLCTLDALDGTFEATAIVGGEYTAATTGVDIGAIDAPSWTANQLAFTGGANTTISRNSGAYFDASNIESGDFIQISGCSSDVDRNCYAFISKAGPTRLQLDTNGIALTAGNEAGSVVLKRLIRPVFFDSDDDVRIADASFSAGTRRKKYSYVKRTHFLDADGAEDAYDNWFANNCDLSKPSMTAISFSDATCDYNNDPTITMDDVQLLQVGMSVSGTGIPTGAYVSSITNTTTFELSASTTGGSVTNGTLTFGTSYQLSGRLGYELTVETPTGGSFPAKTWQVASSFIYEDGQESLLYIPYTGSSSAPMIPLSITTAANDYIDLDVRITAPLDERVTGGRLYIRQLDTADPWTMLADISLKDGVRARFDSEYHSWARDGNDNYVYSNTTKIMDENFETYSIINGFAPDEFKIDLQATGESYKTAILANRRCFIANVKMLDPEGDGTSDLIRMRDRIMYSPPGKFDTFPRSFFIDVVRGDADEYTALAYYADRLFAFKKRTLYIINIASPSPSNWFLESTERDKGVNFPCAVWSAKKGIFWANFHGVFWFDGSRIVDLTEGKIPKTAEISGQRMLLSYMPLVWYMPTVNSLFIKNSAYSPDEREGQVSKDNRGTWVYNFDSGGWSRIRYDEGGTEALQFWANIVTVSGGTFEGDTEFYTSAITQQKSDGSLDTTALQTALSASLVDTYTLLAADKQILKTKDIDFGNPARIKKIYSVTLSYKAGAAMTTPVSYATDGGSSFTNFTGNFSSTGSGIAGDTWAKLRATLAAPVECQSMQIKVQNTAQNPFQLNDISIEYRMLNKRVS
jgi:hypothetical protein